MSKKVLALLGLSILVVCAATAVAGENEHVWGTAAAASQSQRHALTRTDQPLITPSAVFVGAQYGSGGKGMRNQQGGGIVINGVTLPVMAAVVYWAVITTGPAPSPTGTILITKRIPDAHPTVVLKGTVVGTGPSPCWPGDTITVYSAAVPLTTATGNGLYEIRFRQGVFGSVAGEDPWVSAVDPLLEGASLVIVGTGPATSTVGLYDVGLAGNTFIGSYSYDLAPPGPVTTFALWDTIGADGQVGVSRTANPSVAGEATSINGVPVAGPGSTYNDSDWDGAAGWPLPQLWDDSGHDISSTISPASGIFAVSISGGIDCLTPVANVLQVQ